MMKPRNLDKSKTIRFSCQAMILKSLCLLLLMIPSVHAQQAQLSLADILIGLRSNKVTLVERNKLLAGAVEARGITFALTAEIEKELENTGADLTLISAIKQKVTFVKSKTTTEQKLIPVVAAPAPATVPVELDAAYYKKQADENLAKGNLDGALSNYDKAIALSPANPSVIFNRGALHVRSKNYELAISDYDKVIELNPNDVIAYSSRANSHEKLGNEAKAVADYKKILEIDAANAGAFANLKRIEDDKLKAAQKQKDLEAELAKAELEKNKVVEAPTTEPIVPIVKARPEVVDLGRITSSMVESMVTPVYSQIAKSMNLTGQITVELEFDETGDVTSAKSTSGHKMLRETAEQAAKRTKFKPVLVDGTPVKAKGIIVYSFVR